VAKNKAINELNNLGIEEFNLNIRRFVDNAPPAEPHDVYAHLQGGIPESEVSRLKLIGIDCYPGLNEKLFETGKDGYLKFSDFIPSKDGIKKLFDESEEIKMTHAQYTTSINEWWLQQVPLIEQLPEQTINVFDLYHKFSATLTEKLIALPVLDGFKSRGSFAGYWNTIINDIKSVIASGWNAELIPDDEILESQFPDVLKELRVNEAKRDELEARFEEVNELEDDVWNEEDYEVWRSKELKEHKDTIKALKGERKEADREYNNLLKRIKANEKALKKHPELTDEITFLKIQEEKIFAEIQLQNSMIESFENRVAKHNTLEEELKQSRKIIKEIKDKKQNLVDVARLQILPAEAKELILKRWLLTLHSTINGYLQTHQRTLLQAVENLWDKYTTPLHSILTEREKETKQLDKFLIELGYE
jgi:type I restriction enzyme M protein